MPETIYLDTCALNRLTDDKSQARVRAEAEAVDNILGAVASGSVRWLASSALRYEIGQNQDPVKRGETMALLIYAEADLALSLPVEQRAFVLRSQCFGDYDALHLALCEAGHIDVLLTVDDRFARRAATLLGTTGLQVLNPVDWWARRRTWRRNP